MASSKYVDVAAIVQVIGAIYNQPSLLDMEDKYHFNEEDFTEEFHQVIFGSIYNLHVLGAKEITINAIEDYLEQRPKKLAIYKANKGQEYLEKIKTNTQIAAFDYYYNRMKKMTLFRMYQSIGMDLSWLYDVDNIFDVKKKQVQEDWLDNTPIEEIADLIDKKVEDIKLKYVDNADGGSVVAGDGALELLEQLRQHPEVGYPLYGPIINTITRGARLKKFYLRSAATNVGKTRAMIADACFIGCDELYDKSENKWIPNGTKEKVLFIATEQDIDEIQTMMLAFLANVDEDHIRYNTYVDDEWDRAVYAANLLKNSFIYIRHLPDFSLQDIENTIKYEVREHEVQYIFYDYIHSSLKILSEVSSKAKVKELREDNVLFMISAKLKDLCNEYGIFILTSTQLNAEYRNAEIYDQNLLRGAKSIADKVDLGLIMLEVTSTDLEKLGDVIRQGGFEVPEVKISVYKNRGNKYKNILIWCKKELGTCRIEPMFVTNYSFELLEIDDLRIRIKPKVEASAF